MMFAKVKRCSVYGWRDKMIVVPISESRRGNWSDLAPVVLASFSSVAVTAAVRASLEQSRKGRAPKDVAWPVLAAVGVATEDDFYQDAFSRCIFITERSQRYTAFIWNKASDGRGYEPSKQGSIEIPFDVNKDEPGVSVLNLLGI